MTQCLCPKHIYVWPLESDAPGKGVLTQSRSCELWGSSGKEASLSSRRIRPFTGKCITTAFHFGIIAGLQCISCLQVFIFSMQIYSAEILFDLELCFARSKFVLLAKRCEVSFSTSEKHLEPHLMCIWSKGFTNGNSWSRRPEGGSSPTSPFFFYK